MSDSLKRKNAQLDLDVWQEAKDRITAKEKIMRANKDYREVTMSEVIADAFIATGWKRK